MLVDSCLLCIYRLTHLHHQIYTESFNKSKPEFFHVMFLTTTSVLCPTKQRTKTKSLTDASFPSPTCLLDRCPAASQAAGTHCQLWPIQRSFQKTIHRTNMWGLSKFCSLSAVFLVWQYKLSTFLISRFRRKWAKRSLVVAFFVFYLKLDHLLKSIHPSLHFRHYLVCVSQFDGIFPTYETKSAGLQYPLFCFTKFVTFRATVIVLKTSANWCIK